MTAPLPDVIPAALLAELLDCSVGAVEEATRAGRLPGVKYGRSWVYPRDAALQVLTTQALANVRPAPVAASASATGPAIALASVRAPTSMPVAPRTPGRQPRRPPTPLPDPPTQGQANHQRGPQPS